MKPNMFDFVERLVNWNGILGIQLGIEIIIGWRLIDSFLVHVSYDTLQVHKFIYVKELPCPVTNFMWKFNAAMRRVS